MSDERKFYPEGSGTFDAPDDGRAGKVNEGDDLTTHVKATLKDYLKSITEKNFSKDEGMVQVIFNDGLIYLSLKGIIDFEQEKNRLHKSLLKIEKEMNKIDIKLKSESFTQNAPAEIIDEQKNRYKEYKFSKEKIEVAIKSLG